VKLKGIVLAGGKSSRFGADKALARWEGKTLLEHAVRLLTALDLDPAVIANPTKNYDFLNGPVHNDLVPDKGPIGGLCTAFSVFPQNDLLVLTCDMPFLTRGALEQLILAYRASDRPAVFEVGGVQQPFPGIYPSACQSAARSALASERLSMKYFLSLLPDLLIAPEPAFPKLLLNVNTPKDLF
jgi:molybdopterin-guanine dinucleotide biosynthesis protein A